MSDRSNRLIWKGVSAAASVLASCALGLALVLAVEAAPPSPAGSGPPGREVVWRSIFARPAIAEASPTEAAKVALGHDLFRDNRLSGAGQASCASCHDPQRAFTDGRRVAKSPTTGADLARNAPALYDLAWAISFFWDGRAESLAAQARVPILAADELAGDFPTIVARFEADADLAARFARAFPDQGVTEQTILESLAAYQRALLSPETRFDRWVAGDDDALSLEERRGFDLFVGKGGCVACHGGWRLSDGAFHDIGLPGDDPDRATAVPGGAGPLFAFKTPSLREVAHTAPYMHDGSLPDLSAVIDHYAGGLEQRPSLAPALNRDLQLSAAERADLIAFLRAVSSESESHDTAETSRPMIKK